FAMSNADMEMTSHLYLAVLPADEPSPMVAESDEAVVTSDEDDEGDEGDEEESEEGEEADEDIEVVIDFANLAQRIVALPVADASHRGLKAGEAGKVYYLKTEAGSNRYTSGQAAALCRFDLESREEETLSEGVSEFVVSADGTKLLLHAGESWRIVDAGEVEPGDGVLNTGAIQVRVDPRAEWEQIFNEAWRINRDYFYDPGMHGADWPALREQYQQFLPDLACRDDLNRVMRWMCSELSVGHHYLGGGDFLDEPEDILGGLLGADFVINDGRYRFERIYGGLNWNPDLRAPLTEPGVDVNEGDFLLAVDGVDLLPSENLYRRFEQKADRIVELTVGPRVDYQGSRTVKVTPAASESSLRLRAWVEDNIRKVHEATDGRVAYVWLPNTSTQGHTYFKRYFFPQADKEAIILDERFNRGGQIADYYIDIMRRPHLCNWAFRYGQDLETPLSAIHGPKVMITDETAGSGGDFLPWSFRQLGVGTIVGKRTWGGLVGILGFPPLMDGGYVSAPNLAIWTEDGFIVENVGVPPDIEVEQWPAEVIAGKDPQLERAIEEVLRQLAENPPVERVRPEFPVRVRQ
ncbi:MAG: PDZ domain-containing protein, partial [bacterium]